MRRKLMWKLLWNGIVTVPLLLWFSGRVTLGMAALTSVCFSAAAYIIGDQLVLRTSNNLIASVTDALLAFFVLWLASYFAHWDLSVTELSAIGIALGLVEYMYHSYLRREDERHA